MVDAPHLAGEGGETKVHGESREKSGREFPHADLTRRGEGVAAAMRDTAYYNDVPLGTTSVEGGVSHPPRSYLGAHLRYLRVH